MISEVFSKDTQLSETEIKYAIKQESFNVFIERSRLGGGKKVFYLYFNNSL